MTRIGNPDHSEHPVSSDPSREKRVLIVSPQPFFEERGTPIAIHQVILALLELGFEVDLVSYPIGQTIDLPGLTYFRSPNPLRFRTVPIGFSIRKLILDLAMIPTLLRRLSRPYAYIHAVEEGALLVCLVAPRRRTPVLYDMASSIPEQLSELRGARSRPIRAILYRCEKWLLAHVDAVVASRGLGHRIRGKPLREWQFPSPVRLVPTDQLIAKREALGLAARPVVGYVGSLARYQGVVALIDAMPRVLAEYPDTAFLVVGGSASEIAELARRADALGVAESLRALPRQPRDTVGEFLQVADVLVSPRAYGDNLPLKVFDYLAAGRPIVATDIPCHRSVLSDETATFARNDAEGLADAIVLTLKDPSRRARLSEAARSYAADNLGWPAFVDFMRDLVRLPLPAAVPGVDRPQEARAFVDQGAGPDHRLGAPPSNG